MVLLVLTLVFLALWLIAIIPQPTALSPAANLLAWITVAPTYLAHITHNPRFFTGIIAPVQAVAAAGSAAVTVAQSGTLTATQAVNAVASVVSAGTIAVKFNAM